MAAAAPSVEGTAATAAGGLEETDNVHEVRVSLLSAEVVYTTHVQCGASLSALSLRAELEEASVEGAECAHLLVSDRTVPLSDEEMVPLEGEITYVTLLHCEITCVTFASPMTFAQDAIDESTWERQIQALRRLRLVSYVNSYDPVARLPLHVHESLDTPGLGLEEMKKNRWMADAAQWLQRMKKNKHSENKHAADQRREANSRRALTGASKQRKKQQQPWVPATARNC